MSVLVHDVIDAMDRWAPPALAYPWDRAGLAVGHPDWPVKKVLATLTIDEQSAEAARQAGADMIVSHHPLIFEPLRSLRADDAHAAMCIELASSRIACFSAHTNLDLAPGGVNDTLADLLGIQNRSALFAAPHAGQVKLVTFVPESHLAAVRDAICSAGAGVIGAYTWCTFSSPGTGTFIPSEAANPYSGNHGELSEEPERRLESLLPLARLGRVIDALRKAHPYEEPAYDIIEVKSPGNWVGLGVKGQLNKPMTLDAFAQHARQALNVQSLRVLGSPSSQVHRVGVMGGSGGSHINEIGADIDVYVTGDVNYHAALDARRRGLAVIDAGHDGTEKCIVPVMAGYLREQFARLDVSEFVEPGLWQ